MNSMIRVLLLLGVLAALTGCPQEAPLLDTDSELVGTWKGLQTTTTMTGDISARVTWRFHRDGSFSFTSPGDAMEGSYGVDTSVFPHKIDIRVEEYTGPPSGGVIVGRTARGLYFIDDGELTMGHNPVYMQRPLTIESAGTISLLDRTKTKDLHSDAMGLHMADPHGLAPDQQ